MGERMVHFVANMTLVTEECCNCGIGFAMTRELQKRLLDKPGSTFYCPAGHAQHYTGKSEAQKLREELQRRGEMLENANARAARAENERQAIAKAHRKMRARVMNGVCPCCNRTFQNLMNHMRSEHPDFTEIQSLAVLRQAFGMTQAAVAQEAHVLPIYVSGYERGKPVPERAKERLDFWVEQHTKADA